VILGNGSDAASKCPAARTCRENLQRVATEVVASRLESLAQIDRLMRALREARFVDGASVVREESPPLGEQPRETRPAPPRCDE